MFAAVLGKRDLRTASARTTRVDPRVFHDAEQPRSEIRLFAELFATAQRLLDHELHQVVCIVLVAGQRAAEAAQPRQQGDEAFTDFLRVRSHDYMPIIRCRGPVSSMGKASAKILRMAAATFLAAAARAQLPDLQIP